MPVVMMKAIWIYAGAVNILAIVLTAADKGFAKIHTRRISEAALLFCAAFGGAPAMYLTMLFIRHKTRKRKFMLGLPLIMLLQVLAVVGAWFLFDG